MLRRSPIVSETDCLRFDPQAVGFFVPIFAIKKPGNCREILAPQSFVEREDHGIEKEDEAAEKKEIRAA